MSEEEKEAIEYFKSNLEMTKEMRKKWGFQEEIKNNEILLNLIEKLQKEIQSADHLASVEFIEENFISKDKIREKIEEYKNIQNIYFMPKDVVKILESLLEEGE